MRSGRTAQRSGQLKPATALLRRAIELGVDHVDGFVRWLIRDAIRPADDIVVVTKIGAEPNPDLLAAAAPAVDSEITWLLHRAAQRMRGATGEQAEQHGLTLRDYIVLSALHKSPGLTQADLGKSLGLDKTTLMSQLDRLENGPERSAGQVRTG